MEDMEYNEEDNLYFSQFTETLNDSLFTPTQPNNSLDEINLEENHLSCLIFLEGFKSTDKYLKSVFDFFL